MSESNTDELPGLNNFTPAQIAALQLHGYYFAAPKLEGEFFLDIKHPALTVGDEDDVDSGVVAYVELRGVGALADATPCTTTGQGDSFLIKRFPDAPRELGWNNTTYTVAKLFHLLTTGEYTSLPKEEHRP